MSNVCLTTFIYGDKYQDYIPLLVFSIKKSYPNYNIVLFLYDSLRLDIKIQLENLNLFDKVIFKENTFKDCPKMNPKKSMALRWVLWDNSFLRYDYIYIVDIDMLYLREPIEIHQQHKIHMDFINMPFSNIRRAKKINSLNLTRIIQRIHNAGFIGIFNFIKSHNKIEYCLSGLHFIDVRKYYSILTPELLNNFKLIIYKNYFKHILSPDAYSNEIFLNWMLTQVGFNLSNIGIQHNSTSMLDFNVPNKKEFRPHHGIHLGIFREEIEKIPINSKEILDSDEYMYYIEYFKSNFLTDETFIKLSKSFNYNLKTYFQRLHNYYQINYEK